MRILFFAKKKFIKCYTMCLIWKKVIFSRKIISKHEQNVLKSGLHIIIVRNVKMKWIVRVILQNPKRHDFFSSKHHAKNASNVYSWEKKKHLVLHTWRMPRTIFFKKELHHTSCAVTWTQSCGKCGKNYGEKWWNIKCYNM